MRKLTILLLLIMPMIATAQDDTSTLRESFFNAVSVSTNNMALFNGKQHMGYPPNFIGIPYFKTTEWLPGSVVYSGVFYDDLQLKYDLVSNQLVVKYPNGYTAVSLFTPRVEQFTIGEYKFFQVFNDKALLPPGVYQEMQKGRMKLYANRSKIIEEMVTGSGVERKFLDKNGFYVVLDGVAYQIRKQKTIMDLLGDKKSAVKAHLKSLGIKFRGNQEAAINEIVKFYNQ